MKPLEHRRWFVTTGFVVALILMGAWWNAARLPLSLQGSGPLLFAVLGLWVGLNQVLAVFLIRLRPSLGAVD